ncbi:MAG: hypothetical protein ACLGHC_07245, partial [Alphaproteobacteria bacterium]
TWLAERNCSEQPGVARPVGFYAHRYVLAASKDDAIATAFRRVRLNLDQQTGWLRDGLASLKLEAEEIRAAPVHKLLKPDNRGHTFYANR